MIVTLFKCGLIGDTHSEVTIIPLEDLNNQNGNVSELLLKQEWLFHVTTNIQVVFYSSLTN